MPAPKVKIYKLSDLKKLKNDEILTIARHLGINTSSYTSEIGGKETLWTHENRDRLIGAILKKNPTQMELKNAKLNKISLIWAIITSLLTSYLALDKYFAEKKSTTKSCSEKFVQEASPQQKFGIGSFSFFDAKGLKFGSLIMGENAYLKGKIVDIQDDFYIVDFSNAIYGLDNPLVKVPKNRKL